MERHVRCVAGVVLDDKGRLLMVRRGREPGLGLWSIPGGRVEAGESDSAALVRELREETGLIVSAGALIGSVTRPGLAGVPYDIYDYFATVTGGTLVAGDDAAEARWVDFIELRTLPTSPGLVAALIDWRIIPEENPSSQ